MVCLNLVFKFLRIVLYVYASMTIWWSSAESLGLKCCPQKDDIAALSRNLLLWVVALIICFVFFFQKFVDVIGILLYDVILYYDWFIFFFPLIYQSLIIYFLSNQLQYKVMLCDNIVIWRSHWKISCVLETWLKLSQEYWRNSTFIYLLNTIFCSSPQLKHSY